MSAIAFLPLLMLVLVVLGGLAAVVYSLVYAIANKRRGLVAWTVGFALLASLVGFKVLVGWIHVPRPVVLHSNAVGVNERPAAYSSNYEGKLVVASDGRISSMSLNGPATDPPQALAFQWNVRLGTIVFLGVVFIGVLLSAIGRRGPPASDGGRRFDWRWAVPMVMIPLALVLYMRLSQSNWDHVAENHRGPRAMSDVESARWHMEQARHDLEVAGKQAGESAHETMQELWEQLNKPRIPLDADANNTSSAADSDMAESARQADASGSENVAEDDGSNPLADKAERIARLARLLASVATQVSDVASAVGRGFVTGEQPEPIEKSAQPEKPKVVQQPDDAAKVEVAEHVEPADSAPTERPHWVDDPPKRVGNVSREVIVAGDYATEGECVRATDVYLLLATYEHVEQITGISQLIDRSRPNLTLLEDSVLADGKIVFSNNGWSPDGRLNRLNSAGIGIDFIRREIAQDEYLETVERLPGEMKRLYTLVEFTPSVDRELRERWNAWRRSERFVFVGASAGGVFGLLAMIFGLLKVDTLTKGYYTKRLFLGVPAAIIGVIIGLMTWFEAIF